MKTFKVVASFSTYCQVFIEAETQEQAQQLAYDLDGSSFEAASMDAWQIESVEEFQQ